MSSSYRITYHWLKCHTIFYSTWYRSELLWGKWGYSINLEFLYIDDMMPFNYEAKQILPDESYYIKHFNEREGKIWIIQFVWNPEKIGKDTIITMVQIWGNFFNLDSIWQYSPTEIFYLFLFYFIWLESWRDTCRLLQRIHHLFVTLQELTITGAAPG